MPNSPRLVRWIALPLMLALLACNLITPAVTPAPPPGTPTPVARPSQSLPSPTAPGVAAPTVGAPTVAPPTAAPTTTAAPTAESPTAAPAGTATPADTPLATPAASAIPTRAETSSPGGLKLSSSGPWLVFSAQDGIWAANADGTGLTLLMKAGPFFRLGPAAPRGGHVVVVTGSDETGFHGLTLWLLSLPGGELTKITALTDASTEPGPNAQFGDIAIDIITPLGQADWSPNGADLAFIGAQAGPSADLFSDHLATGKVTRLTDGPSQAYGPSWSPDGRYVLQFGAKTFGTGAGFAMDGVWAAAADSSGVKLLYKPDSGGENLLGWAGPETFAVSSFYVACENGKARTFNIADGSSQPTFPGYYSQIAADPASGAALVAVDQYAAECVPDTQQGLFLARPGAKPLLLDANAGAATNLGWAPAAGLFYAFSDAGWRAYTPDGQPAPVPDGVTGEPAIGPAGKNWAWVDTGSGLLEASLGGAAAQPLSAVTATLPTWSPDGQTLFFFGDDKIWAGDPHNGPPKALTPGVTLSRLDVVEWAK